MPDLTFLGEAVQELAKNVSDLKTEIHSEAARGREEQKSRLRQWMVPIIILLVPVLIGMGIAIKQNGTVNDIALRLEECEVPSTRDDTHQCYEDDRYDLALFISYGIECLNEDQDLVLADCIVQKDREQRAEEAAGEG